MDLFSLLSSCRPIEEVETNAIRLIRADELSTSKNNSQPPDLSSGFISPPPPFEECLQDVEKNESGLCQVCRSIDLKSQGYKWIVKAYGTAQQIFARQHCAICRLVLWVLAKDMGFLDPAALPNTEPGISCNVQWLVNHTPNQKLYLIILTEKLLRGSIVPLSADSPALEVRKQLSANRQDNAESGIVDVPRIRAWIDECEQLHTGPCRTGDVNLEPMKINNLMLIDVGRMQLVEAPSRSRYITLSYVWGHTSMLKTTGASLRVLKQERGLLLFIDQIPRVVKDAIDLVVALGERYLWVDSLCIVQDDAVRKHEQILQMDTIYGRALLSIIAVAGETANSPLPGVRPNTRMSIPALEVVEDLCLVPQGNIISRMLEDSVYESRAWTLQERLLSKRCLFFTKWAVYYQCSSMAFREDEDLFDEDPSCSSVESSKSNSRFTPQSMIWNPLRTAHSELSHQETASVDWIHGFRVYNSIVEVYTKRRLSYSSDILNAFSGIGRELEQRYGGRLVHGLPEAVLDIALLWTPADVAVKRRRVMASTGSMTSFPSWTWAGWEGSINFVLPQNILDQAKPGCTSVRAEIGMLSIGGVSCGRPLERQKVSDIIEHPVCTPSPQEQRCVKDVDEDVLHFWTTASETQVFTVQGQQRYHLQEPMPATRILDGRGRHCGLLLSYENAISMDKWNQDSTYEFVSISTSALFNLIPFVEVSLCFRIGYGLVNEPLFDGRVYKLREGEMGLVNIMLIDWDGDLAERVAIGCMHKDAWTNVNRRRRYVRLK